MRSVSFVTKTSSESKTGSHSESRDPLMGRIVHCQGKGGNGVNWSSGWLTVSVLSMGMPLEQELVRSEVVEGLVRADGVVDGFPGEEFLIERGDF